MIKSLAMVLMPLAEFKQALAEYGESLKVLARESIAYGMARGVAKPVELTQWPQELVQPGASFVTLMLNGELRGCIGSITAVRPLVVDISDNAFAAAFRDFRFAPLNGAEFESINVSISVLSPLQIIEVKNNKELEECLVPNLDGVVLEYAVDRRAVFLPQVWESLSDPHEFLLHLKQKGGIPAAAQPPDLKAYRFGVVKL